MNALAVCGTARRVPPASQPELSRKDDQPVSQISLVRASRRHVLLAGLAAAAASAGLSAAAQDAQAAFTLGACGGSNAAKNQGASFQNGAQTYWRSVFANSNGCGGAVSLQAYLSNGSGNGRAAMGAGGGSSSAPFINCAPACGTANSGGGRSLAVGERDLTTAFASTDEGPTPTQQAGMNAGGPSASDDGLVHVIPAATGATVILAHPPNGCDLSTITNKTGEAGDGTGDTAADKTQRLRLTNTLLEAAFAGDSNANTWGEIAPGISGTPTAGGQNDALPCADVPVKRIVRQDDSGTTFAFKAFLSLINPSRGWLSTYNPAPNTVWPAAGGSGTASPVATGPTPSGGAAPAGGAFCSNTAANLLCSRNASGGGGLAAAVTASEGSIGYVDLATARSNQFEITPTSASVTTQDYTFWTPIQNNPGGTGTKYVEPTVDPLAHKPGVGARGSNCGDVAVRNAPTPANSPRNDPTLGDWSTTFAAGGAGYSNCVLTYIMAWDDSAPVYGNTADEQGKARTVKDFLATAVVSAAGQQFVNVDYSALPNPQATPLLKYAQDGVNAIDWNKAASGGQQQQQQQNQQQQQPPQQQQPITIPKVIPPVVTSSNSYTVSSGKLNSARSAITYSVKLPSGGTLSAVSTYVRRGKTVKVSTVSVSPSGASTVRLTVRLTSRARSDLRRLKRLRISTRFTYTPAGGTAASQRKAVNVRVKATKKKKKK